MSLLILLADVNGELLDLGEELGLCRVVAVLFAGPLATQSQSGLGQTHEMFVLCNGCLEILFIPLLAGVLRQNLRGGGSTGETTTTAMQCNEKMCKIKYINFKLKK